jgi:hypothetical protein
VQHNEGQNQQKTVEKNQQTAHDIAERGMDAIHEVCEEADQYTCSSD